MLLFLFYDDLYTRAYYVVRVRLVLRESWLAQFGSFVFLLKPACTWYSLIAPHRRLVSYSVKSWDVVVPGMHIMYNHTSGCTTAAEANYYEYACLISVALDPEAFEYVAQALCRKTPTTPNLVCFYFTAISAISEKVVLRSSLQMIQSKGSWVACELEVGASPYSWIIRTSVVEIH